MTARTRAIHAEPPAGTVIAADVFDAHVEASAIVAQARKRAARIERDAHARGLEDGRAQAAAALVGAAQARRAALDAAGQEILQTASALAKQLVGETLAAEPGRIATIVAPLLMRVRLAKKVLLRVHPDDACELRKRLATGVNGDALPAGLEFEEDGGMARGGCVLSSDIGGLDARIETRLDALVDALGRSGA